VTKFTEALCGASWWGSSPDSTLPSSTAD